MFLRIVFIILILMTTTIFAQNPVPPLENGVSQTLAKWRAANYSDVRYKLNITLEKNAPLMKGEIEIGVKLTDEGAKNDLVLDWRTTQFANDKDKPFAEVESVNDKSVKETVPNGVFDYQTNKEHLIISKKYLKTGENTIKIKFASPIKTSGAGITRYVDKEDGAEYVYSLFVPSDASTAFPVFDQPDLKAKFSLSLETPISWKVVSNTAIENSSTLRLEKTISNQDGYTKHAFFETKPISTYVFAFAAGDFAEFEDKNTSMTSRVSGSKKVARRETSGTIINTNYSAEGATENISRTFGARVLDADETRRFTSGYSLAASSTQKSEIQTSKIYVRKSQAEKFKAHAAEVFRLNREGVKFLESYFDYKFPFPKYDLVLIPEFPFGGMEHAGATFLREASVIFPTEPTKNDYVSRANVIFHEAAHQWFGDTVTMKWFDDLWLKEGFAEFMAYKTLEKVMPEYNAWKIFYERNKQTAYLTDSTRGTTPIYQEIANLSAAKSAYGNIVYRKAPSFLKQAEFYLGEKEFQTAVRAFLKKHEFANAEWTDLVKEFETASKQDLKDWANVWVTQPGMPIFTALREDNKEKFTVGIIPRNKLNDKTFWKMKTVWLIKSTCESKNKRGTFRDCSMKQVMTVDLPKDGNPGMGSTIDGEDMTVHYFFPNYQDYGYGIFLLDEKSRAYVLANIQTEKDDFLRTMMWGSLWDSVREGELNPKVYVELVIKNLAIEQDESTIQTLLNRVGTAMNYYLNDASRNAFASRIETLLAERTANAQTQGQRITFYRAYLNLASSAAAQKNLKEILTGKSKIAVFALKTKDKFDIVTRLLILGDKDAPALLANLEKTETSDEAKRYAYAARAGVGTADTKAKYFRDFMTNKEISESWIESAFVPFNSVRHSDLTLPYLETALAELPNLKRNRKIFFVNGWLGAFIGGQRSAEALAIVNKFLADNPNLDKDLRLKILENADGLERAVKIREKFGK